MVTKPKAPAKPSGAVKKAVKAPVKAAVKVAAKAPVKAAKVAAKAPAKPVAKKAAPAAKGVAKVAAKVAAKVPAKSAAKVASSPAAAKAPATKTAPAKPAPKLPAVKASAKPVQAPRHASSSPQAGSNVVAGAAALAALPPPKPPVRMPQVVSPKDLASAHEYLLTRSAGRSEAPEMVNGRLLPTEEQLLGMPEASYMNSEQLAFFRHRLQRMERELLSNADETTEHLRETVIVPDPADRATIEEEHALELRTRDRERKLLKKVQASLAQIEAGEYGYCEETGDPIGIPRLLARPTATLSLEAQQRREIKQKLFGD